MSIQEFNSALKKIYKKNTYVLSQLVVDEDEGLIFADEDSILQCVERTVQRMNGVEYAYLNQRKGGIVFKLAE